MQKKTLVLAISAALSLPAFAQSNVQLYGVVDYGYSYRFDRYNGTTAAKTNSRLDAGLDLGNRLGFKGVEEIGNGLKALFVLERGFVMDTGADKGGFNRQAYVGLAGDWGTLAGGRLYSPYYNLISSVDPFGDGTVGQFSNIKYDVQELFNPVRVDNTLAYISPDFGGFNFTLAYSNNAGGDDSVARSDTSNNNSVATLAANYANGAFTLGASYHYIVANAEANVDNIQDFTLGATYDCGFAKAAFAWSWDSLKYASGAGLKDFDQNNFLIGATVPFGKHAIKAAFNYSKGEKFIGDAWQLGVGYAYQLSKRTNFYVSYAIIDNDETTATRIGRKAVVGDGSNSGGVYQQGFQLGLTHRF